MRKTWFITGASRGLGALIAEAATPFGPSRRRTHSWRRNSPAGATLPSQPTPRARENRFSPCYPPFLLEHIP